MTPPTKASTAGGLTQGLLPRTRKGWAALVLAILMVGSICAFFMARGTPPWYQPLDASDQQVIDDAERAQRKIYLELNNTLQAVPLGEQKWTITQDEVNSLIAIHMAQAGDTTSKGKASIPNVSDPVVVFTPGKITLAARTPKAPGSDPRGGVVSVVFAVKGTLVTEGSPPVEVPAAEVRISGLWVGNLPVPKSIAEDRVRALLPTLIPEVERTLNLQLGPRRTTSMMREVKGTAQSIVDGEPFPLEFKFDRRSVVIREIRVDDGSLTITFVPPTPAGVRPR